jgi:LmbE family N-acetylglucosaminyl deacetylase
MTLRRTGLGLALLALTIPVAANAQTAAAPAHWWNNYPGGDPANLKGERPTPRTGLELPIDQGAAGLQQTLLKLHTRASLMMIVAHPDDEDGGMLTYEVRGHGVRAAMMTLTRGEGGQNLMTGDFNDALGLIRTQELLAADRYFGTDQMFGTEVDFGFSKTKEETLTQWGYDRVLYDAVRAVRLYRPLVVTSVFVGGPTDGHGHHQVSGQMAQEVFTAAADPKVFPEMGLEPWAPLKVYARVPFAQASKEGIFDYATGKYVPVRFYNYVTKVWTDAVPQANVTIHEGEYSNKLGMTYVQFAREGLALQKTQIGAGIRVPPAGAFDVGYTRYGSRVTTSDNEKSFFDGIDTSIEGIAKLAPGKSLPRGSLENIARLVDEAVAGYSAKDPAKIAPLLAEGLKATRTLIAEVGSARNLTPREVTDIRHELLIKQAQFELALAQALGISFRAEATEYPDLHVKFVLKNDGPDELRTLGLALPRELGDTIVSAYPFDSGSNKTNLLPGATLETQRRSSIRSTLSSRPYFSRKNAEQAFYDLSYPVFRNAPATPPAQTWWAGIEFGGVPFSIASIVSAPHSASPLWALPAVSVALSPSAGILTPGEKSFTVSTHLENATGDKLTGRIHLELPTGWQSEPKESQFTLSASEPAQKQTFRVTPVAGAAAEQLRATARIGVGSSDPGFTLSSTSSAPLNADFTESFRKVGYPGLPETYFFTPATYRTRAVNVHIAPNLRVAYLPGTGDEVQSLLENIGIHATTLSVTDIAQGKLADFDTLVLGARAYTAHSDLLAANRHILDFAQNGGTVIVQYQAHAFRATEAPFPITLVGDGDKVVEELAKVNLTASSTGVLDWPNKVVSADFDNWVEERGHGFPVSWDEHYDAPTETHDTGQDPQRGGLLVARYGKGYYAYCAYALYRQLPEAVPGAYRLFANLLSLGHQPSAK